MPTVLTVRPRFIVRVTVAVAAVGLVTAGCSGGNDSRADPRQPRADEQEAVSSDFGWGLRWTDADTKVVGTPTVVGRTALAAVRVGNARGSEAVDVATGRVLWQVLGRTPNGISPRPIGRTTASGPVAVGVEADTKNDALLVARAATSGEVRWSRSLPQDNIGYPRFESPLGCGPLVCVLESPKQPWQHTLDALDPASGKPRWSVPVGDMQSIVWADDSQVVLASTTSLTSWSVESGRKQWTAAPAGGVDTRGALSGAAWYEFDGALVGSVTASSGSSSGPELVAIDTATGRVRWVRRGWRFVGDGQPTTGADGTRLAAAVLLAIGPDKQFGALDASGAAVWTVRDDEFWRAPSYELAWTADLSQAWVWNGVDLTFGRRMSDGASVRGKPDLLWVPHVNPVLSSSFGPSATVDVTRFNDAHLSVEQAGVRPPDWAGPMVAGIELTVDSDGDLAGVRR